MIVPVSVGTAETLVTAMVGWVHGCGGSVVVGSGADVGWKDVEFPNTVTSCVTVSVVLGANAKEVATAQYDTHILPT